jgi:hypothetical protein
MSVAPPPTSGVAPTPEHPPTPSPGEACPLCRAPLHPEQEWCLSCGAAARTRLAASPRWKAPIVTLVVVLVLCLGVLAGSLVKLAGGTTPATTQTTTVTAPAATTATQAQLPTTTATAPITPTTPTTGKPSATAPRGALPGTGAGTGTGASAPITPKATRSLEAEMKLLKLKSPALKKAVEERLRKAGLAPNSTR